MAPWGWNFAGRTPRELTPTEVFDSIVAELTRLQTSGETFQPFINHGETGDFLIVKPTPGDKPLWLAETCFEHFVNGPSFFVECRVHWTRTMAYWKAQPSELVRAVVFFNEHGRADGRACPVSHCMGDFHQTMEIRGGYDYLLRAYTMTGMTLEQRQELCGLHNEIRYPNSWHSAQRRCQREQAAAAG